jgi:hypothetical protein
MYLISKLGITDFKEATGDKAPVSALSMSIA